jgi:O6-methylguanine-DNA--protein-cysteine methyltransferase
LRKQQEEALLRNSAAIGGLGGGNVRTALQEQAYGIASTDQQRVLENLRSLATRGQSAATTQSGLQAQGGLSGSALETSAGTQLANIALNQGTQESNLISQLQSAIASGQIQVGQQDAQILEQLGINVGNLTNQTATNQANIASQLGSGLSGITQQGATTLANIATGQGTQLSNLASNIGSAQAAGIVGTANAYQQGIQNLTGLAGAYYGAQ